MKLRTRAQWQKNQVADQILQLVSQVNSGTSHIVQKGSSRLSDLFVSEARGAMMA